MDYRKELERFKQMVRAGNAAEAIISIDEIRTSSDDMGEAVLAELLFIRGEACIGSLMYPEARNDFTGAAEIFAALGDRKNEAIALGNAGSACRDNNDYVTAIDFYQKALDIYQELNDDEGIADQSANIAYADVYLNEMEEAVNLFMLAGDIYRSRGLSEKAEMCARNVNALVGQ